MHWFFYVQTCETHGKCVENMVFCRFHCCFLELWQFMGMQSRENYILWMQKYPFSNEECCETQWKLYQKAENAENGRKPKKHMIFFFKRFDVVPEAHSNAWGLQCTVYRMKTIHGFCCQWFLLQLGTRKFQEGCETVKPIGKIHFLHPWAQIPKSLYKMSLTNYLSLKSQES